MQKIPFLFLLIAAMFIQNVNAQNGLNFQGVARSATNAILASQPISLRLSIVQGSSTGTSEYSETRRAITNAQGLFTVVIGDTGAISTIGNYAAINWKLTPKFLKIEMDPTAGTNFITMGTTQFQSVAYAQFAKAVDAENISGVIPISSGGTGVNNLASLKSSLALDKINNTADLDKPISVATTIALNLKLNATDTAGLSARINAKANTFDVSTSLANKVDKFTGKDLSTNDFTTAEKTKLAAITGTNTGDQDVSSFATTASLALKINSSDVSASLANKVDKFTGKDLSTNDFTTAEKTKLAAITGTNTGDQDVSSFATSASVALKANTADLATALALKEDQTNKSADVTLGGAAANDILFPTQKAVKVYVALNSAGGGVADGGITTIKLADLAVTDAKLATGISKSKVGLGSVENTALSTWAGTSNITTVGTIANGTWNGTAIDIAHGGTGATTALGARANLGLVIGTNVQAPLTAGTDYLTPNGSAASLTNFPIFNQNTTGNATTATNAGNITATSNTTLTSLSNLATVGTIISGIWSGTAIAVTNGGTGETSLTGIVKGNGTSAMTAAIAGTDYQAPIILTTTGSGAATFSGTTLNIPTPTGNATHTIGESYGGGIVFYVTSNALHGLIAETIDQSSSATWGEASDLVTIESNHSVEGKKYADWRLPTKSEIKLLYNNIGQNAIAPFTNIGNFGNFSYWSATLDFSSAWKQEFRQIIINFYTEGILSSVSQSSLLKVRAIRAF
jgi:hypothetical protein